MLGKHSANELHPEPGLTFANVAWDIMKVWEQLRALPRGNFLEPGAVLSPLLFYRASLSCGCELKGPEGTEARESGEIPCLYYLRCLNTQRKVGGPLSLHRVMESLR